MKKVMIWVLSWCLIVSSISLPVSAAQIENIPENIVESLPESDIELETESEPEDEPEESEPKSEPELGQESEASLESEPETKPESELEADDSLSQSVTITVSYNYSSSTYVGEEVIPGYWSKEGYLSQGDTCLTDDQEADLKITFTPILSEDSLEYETQEDLQPDIESIITVVPNREDVVLNGIQTYEFEEDGVTFSIEVIGEEPLLSADAAPILDDVPTGVYGSGSALLNMDNNDTRFYSEYITSGNYQTAGINRQTHINVFAKEGETILFGSSVDNSKMDANDKTRSTVTGADIVITLPDGTKKTFDVVKDGAGYIGNYKQERNGPRINTADQTDADRYIPLQFVAPKTGVYQFDFHSETGKNASTNPTCVKTTDAWGQNAIYVAAWDTTVVGLNDAQTGYEVKDGRTWANYLSLNPGGNTISSLHLHVLTQDGYIYKTDFKEIVPWGFIFFANNMGFTTTGTTPYSIYHSFYDNDNSLENISNEENINVHLPYAADTETMETYKVFFGRPSDELETIGIKTHPEPLKGITDLAFKGSAKNISRFGQGGVFTFKAESATSATITMDLREALTELKKKPDADPSILNYRGSGVIELNGAVKPGENTFYWDGKDTDNEYIPIGLYPQNSIKVMTEAKGGEIHFPIIDMEGLRSGLTIERLNGSDLSGATNVYYNNNPLAYGTIEGQGVTPVLNGTYYTLSNGTKSYDGAKIRSGKEIGGIFAFKELPNGTKILPQNISTLVRDNKDYLAKSRFGSLYAQLTDDQKKIVDEEYDYAATYHHEPVDSSQTSMLIYNYNYGGGGNQAGIDVWTYYAGEVETASLDFAVIDSTSTGKITGTIFYDNNVDTNYTPKDVSSGDIPIKGVTVQLVNEDGSPVLHTESLPQFDEDGFFLRDDAGDVIYKDTIIDFEAVTDGNGLYAFTGVPYVSVDSNNKPTDIGSTYYAHVLLTEVQSEVLKYASTTSVLALDPAVSGFLKAGVTKIADSSGADGTKVTLTKGTGENHTEVFNSHYYRDGDYNTIFDISNAQSVKLSNKSPEIDGIKTVSFKNIGYVTTVPIEHQKTYQVVKDWHENTPALTDGITVQLWIWNDNEIQHEGGGTGLNRRTGTLLDTQKLSAANSWTYSWEHLDDRLQYYVLEYYTKKKDNGELMYNDRGEERLVLIGGTMPFYNSKPANEIYGFQANLGEYKEQIYINGEYRVPVQYFNDGVTHYNSITEREKQTVADTNARQYEATYTLTRDAGTNINKVKLTNSQSYDERAYYVWLNHETVLPDFITKTHLEHNIVNGEDVYEKKTHSVTLTKGATKIEGDEYNVKGLIVSSVDAAAGNAEGNSTDIFRFKDDGKNTGVYFTAKSTGVYKTGTGTRTYKVEYVVDSNDKPVEVHLGADGKILDSAGDDISLKDYQVYTWTLTIHVYDVQPDGIFLYDHTDDTSIVLQQGLKSSQTLSWHILHDVDNPDSISYISNDPREGAENGIIGNDIYRVPLYKYAVEDHMGSCADFVGIAYSPNGIVDDAEAAKLTYWDTNEVKNPTVRHKGDDLYGEGGNGYAKAVGKGGVLNLDLNTKRTTKTNKGQDHLNYGTFSFVPNGNYVKKGDVFYYKVVVFGEDSTYSFTSYDELDASEGVVMYTYLEVKPEEFEGELEITKDLSGNAADTQHYFKVDVTFEAPDGSVITNPIKYSGGYNYDLYEYTANENQIIPGGMSGSLTVSVWLKGGDSVTFSNIPSGIHYKVIEDNYATQGYSLPKYRNESINEPEDLVKSGILWGQNYAVGSITDLKDHVTIFNVKNAVLDVGVVVNNRYYQIMISMLAAVTILWLMTRKRGRRRKGGDEL